VTYISNIEVMEKMQLIKESLQLLEQEETYWINRCHEQWLLKGDSNSKYYHSIANGRKRKNIVSFLESEGNVIEGDENLLKHATEYYSELFGPTDDHNIHIDHNLWAELDQVSDEDNQMLSRPFLKLKKLFFKWKKQGSWP
jgi:hypothetical protein